MAAQYKSTAKLNRASAPPNPLPEKIGLVLQESRWLALIAVAAFLGLALWGFDRADPGWSHAVSATALPPVDVSAVTPQGPLDARYRIDPQGRAPRWAPTAVLNDGVRTFITLSPDAAIDEAPALFVRSGDELQLVNYRQADGVLIVDRVFDEAELRLGDRRPQIVRIRRLEGAPR